MNDRRISKTERIALRPGDTVTFSGMAEPSLQLAANASRPALLVQLTAASEPEVFPLVKAHTAVGRGLAADLRLDQSFISARQCTIELSSAPPLATAAQSSIAALGPTVTPESTVATPLRPSVWLADESRYGTYVNRQRAKGRTELREGDQARRRLPPPAAACCGLPLPAVACKPTTVPCQVSFGGEPPYPRLTLSLDAQSRPLGDRAIEPTPVGPHAPKPTRAAHTTQARPGRTQAPRSGPAPRPKTHYPPRSGKLRRCGGERRWRRAWRTARKAR